MQLPVCLIGQCTAYDRKDGHPAPAHSGDAPRSNRLRRRRLDSAETLMQTMNDHIDMQFLTAAAAPCGRIGFYNSHGHAEEAQNFARLVRPALQ